MIKVASQIWAVVDRDGNVLFTTGGSSTPKKLMCYATKGKAQAALHWAPRIVGPKVVLLYTTPVKYE